MKPTRIFCLVALLSLGACWATYEVPNIPAEHAGTCVRHRDRLICLGEQDGLFRVWGLLDLKFDAEASSKLSSVKITHVASDGETLWAADRNRLLSWSMADQAWTRKSNFTDDGEALERLVVVGKTPLLVFPSRVKDPIGGRTFKVPTLIGQIRTKALRILAIHTGDSMLWIGSGFGEWGGHLVRLNLETGTWAQNYDALHYVTGITQASPDEVIASWSMSHLSAQTLIRIHGPDAMPKQSFPKLNEQYYQAIAYSPFDKTLYGVEAGSIVELKDGKPTSIAEFKGQAFEREPRAMGVAPGISALLPIAPKTLIVVPKHGEPWKLQDGQLTRLEAR